MPLLGNTDVTVPSGTTDLAALGATSTSDMTFSNQVYSPTTFTFRSSQTFRTLNDLSSTASTLSNSGGAAAKTLTLARRGLRRSDLEGVTP